jgi:hypothetical protein
MSNITQRYFHVDDGGARYWIVASDLDGAKQILRDHGVEFTKEDGGSAPIDDPAFADLEWDEVSADLASTKTVHLEDAPTEAESKCKLSECIIGDFFCTEW